MNHKFLIFLLLAVFGCGTVTAQKYVGGDLSMLPKYEEANVVYKDANGNNISDLLTYVRDEASFNTIRVRLFVTPTQETGVCQDLNFVKKFGKRIKDAGMNFMLDFHYSDTWADPKKQDTPSEWANLTDSELYDTIYNYTKSVLQALNDYGATPDFIQTGNEISYGMLWGTNGSSNLKKCYTNSDSNWERFITLLSNASKACREACPSAKIIIHTERVGQWSVMKGFYERIANVDYDIIGVSYYPEWHGNLTTLTTALDSCRTAFPTKNIMIVETGYYNNWYKNDADYDFQSTWSASAEGQKSFLDDLVAAVKDLDYVTGLLYWFPEENPYNNSVYEPWNNHGLFNPNTGQVSDGLFSLKAFLNGQTAIRQYMADSVSANGNIYTLAGSYAGKVAEKDQLPNGIYVVNKKKLILRR